ncbi:MAG: IS110 family RNA-guided transposase [Armatimonadota bacterium]
MLYIGLDVHSKWMTITGLNSETGAIFEEKKIANDERSLNEVFGGFTEPIHGVMESGTNSWAMYRILEPYFEKLIVADPATVWGKDLRRGAKTDRRDALGLALKLQRNELTPLYIPDAKTQDMRALARAKISASRHVTKIVNEIGSQMRSWGIVTNCSLLSVKGQALIKESISRLPEMSRKTLELWLEMLKKTQETEEEIERMIKAEVAKDALCQLLITIPGVGPLTAFVLRAEIGDIERFPSPEALINYCGLCPSVKQSGDKIYFGKLNRLCNRFLKYILILRAQSAARSKSDNPMHATYWRVVVKGKNHAKIAVARQLVRVIYRMLKNKEKWDPSKITERRALSASRVA